VLPSPCYVFSDAHIGAARFDVQKAVVSFLRHLRGRAGSLIVNGDLFEFWFEWRTVMPRSAFRVLGALAELSDAGVPVLWVAGNHDCWGGEILQEDLGVNYHVGAWTGNIAGWNARVEHGDGLRAVEDRKYRGLRAVIRHPLSVWAFRNLLHPDWGTRLASGTAHASRTYRAGDGGRGLEGVAMAALTADPSLDLVVFGHTHVPALDRGPTGGVYANSGAWLEDPTFLRIDEQRVELRRWVGSAEGERLHALDRRAEKSLTQS
jgi:UDP-2,3-diacylglucosamine hydrolase